MIVNVNVNANVNGDGEFEWLAVVLGCLLGRRRCCVGRRREWRSNRSDMEVVASHEDAESERQHAK